MKQWLLKLMLSTVAVLAPVHSIMIMAGVLLILDLVTGLWKAVRTKKRITSSGISRTVTKVIAYNLAIITGFVVETTLVGGLVPVSKIVGSLIALTEATSIFENLSEITGTDFKSIIKEMFKKKE